MTRPWRVVAALAFALLACDESAGPSGDGVGGLAVQVGSAAGAAVLDSGYVRLSGPTSRLVKVAPGASVRIDSLLPGAYTVDLEGFEGANLSHFARVTGVTVVIGQTATATLPTFARIRLAFAVQPVTVGLGRPMTPAVQVQLVDGNGALITSPSARNTIGLGITTNPSGAAFVTAQSVAAVSGVATFGSVALNEAGVGYILAANGASLTGVASTAFNVTNRAVVTHFTTPAAVSFVETSTNAKVGTDVPAVGNLSEDVAFTADGAVAYVANGNTNDVSPINVATGVAATPIPAGTGPRSLAFAATANGPRVYVANFNSANVTVINTATNAVVTTIPVGSGPIRIATTLDGTKALVAVYNADSLAVITTATNTVTARIAVGDTPQGIAITPTGTFAYVANSTPNTVTVVNLGTNAVVGAAIPVGTFPVGAAMAPNGQLVYIANQTASTISVISTTSNTVVGTITLPVGSNRNLAITPGGRFLYVANFATPLVYVASTTTNAVVDTIDTGPTTSAFSVGIAPRP